MDGVLGSVCLICLNASFTFKDLVSWLICFLKHMLSSQKCFTGKMQAGFYSEVVTEISHQKHVWKTLGYAVFRTSSLV